jgi:RimJ/RimL family protein N-acetyltransferase
MANITITTSPISFSDLAPWRELYFAQLREAQEPLLETLVATATAYLIHTREATVGYALVHPEKGVFEYYLDRSQWAFSTEIFGKFLRQHQLTKGLVKSFDDVFMAVALDHQTSVISLGMLVRDYIPRALPKLEGLAFTCTLAQSSDSSRLASVDQDVFTNPERLAFAIEKGFIWLYEAPALSNALIGFGLIKPIRPGSTDADVGIAIDRSYRNKGFALYVMQDLMNRCIASGYRPIAGCALDNLPSRRMGQRIGMAPRHRLVSVTFAPAART